MPVSTALAPCRSRARGSPASPRVVWRNGPPAPSRQRTRARTSALEFDVAPGPPRITPPAQPPILAVLADHWSEPPRPAFDQPAPGPRPRGRPLALEHLTILLIWIEPARVLAAWWSRFMPSGRSIGEAMVRLLLAVLADLLFVRSFTAADERGGVPRRRDRGFAGEDSRPSCRSSITPLAKAWPPSSVSRSASTEVAGSLKRPRDNVAERQVRE